ncbi:hypothetical protein [Ferruginibacter sp.]
MNNKEDKILNSLAGLQKAAAPDFFYTRLLGRMQNESVPQQKQFFLLSPVFVGAVLFLVLILNVFSIVQLNKTPEQKVTVHSAGPASLQSFADAYNMNTALVYE